MTPNKGSLTWTVGLAVLLAVLVPAPAAYAQATIPVQVSAGLYHSCALMSDGGINCWGGNTWGQAVNRPGPGPWIQISAGNFQTCGLNSNGNVDCYGCWSNFVFLYPAYGNFGPFTQIGAGTGNVCGVKPNGDVLCWGEGFTNGLWPGPFSQVEASGEHTCALVPLAAGASSRPAGAYCWGSGNDLGKHYGNFTQVTAGGSHDCALLATGAAACWGGNAYGQSSPPSGTYLQVSAGHQFTCGLRTDRTLACWGYNFYGQVSHTPGPDLKFKQVAAGYGHACAISEGDQVYCWGRNDHGQAIPPNLGGPRVLFTFQGFYPPLEPEQADPALNAAKAGSAVPLKFSLGGDKGLNVIEIGYPASRPLDCDRLDPHGALEPALSAGNHGLSYDTQSGSYTYVWNTEKAWAGTCRVLALRLVDGTDHLAAFRFQ